MFLKKKEYSALSFVQFGTLYNDESLRREDDGFAEFKLKKKILFPLYSNRGNILEKLFVNTNGLISFDEELSYSGDISSRSSQQKRFIAPLWSDIDSRYEGEILFREIEDLDILSDLIKLADLDKSKFIKQFI